LLKDDVTFAESDNLTERIIKLGTNSGMRDCETVVGRAQSGEYQAFTRETAGHNRLAAPYRKVPHE
jgi:hypothetical protein